MTDQPMTEKRLAAFKAEAANWIAHRDVPAAIMIQECIAEITRLRDILRGVSTKHNLLKGLAEDPPKK